MTTTCPDCDYARLERAAIHEFDGKATRAEADRLAASERCGKHKSQESGAGSQEMRITVRRWEKFGENAGEFVGGRRTLAGPYRFGFDGSREVVIEKYRRWLHAEIQARGPVFGKLRDLLPQARSAAGLVLVCVEPDLGEVIARALRWLEGQESGVRNQESGQRKDSAA
jgi:hypothetical protein